jgi:GDPmannose 4,6-dehydratase
VINTDLLRQDEHFQLVANPSKAKRNLGWEPEVSFETLLEQMVQTDIERLQNGSIVQTSAKKLLVE